MLALLIGGGGLIAGCSRAKAPLSPAPTLSGFVKAWARQDWRAMESFVLKPPSTFLSANAAAYADLHVEEASVVAGTPVVHDTTAVAPITETLHVAFLGPLTIHTSLHLVEASQRWHVTWSPTTIDPALGAGDRFSVAYVWPKRAPILGAGGVVLADEQPPMVVVGVQGSFITDAASLSKALIAAGAPAAAVSKAVTAATANPTAFEPVFEISAAEYDKLKPIIYPLPGTVFQTVGGTQPDPAIAPLIGALGPITKPELRLLGPPYQAGSIVGVSGLEQSRQTQLAGTPGGVVTISGGRSGPVATLATFPARPGTPVVTSIDPAFQQAAETALAGVAEESALVAMNTSTGQVEAVVNHNTGGSDLALDGALPPGSTFKVITSTALIGLGLTPLSAATCPTKIDVDGEILHNAGNEAPVANMLQAFTESCNTAFIGLAMAHLTAASYHDAAAIYDIGAPPRMGVPAFAGSVPLALGQTAIAESAIGQDQVVVSPLNLATAASAVASSVVREPRLVAGAPDDRARTHKLPSPLVADLHEMMLSVVQSGTAAGTGLPAGTYAKTGTAEYGSGNPLPLDAWLMGWNGNTAFAMVVVNSPGDGGPTDGPIVAQFLNAVAGLGG
jgi:hypothetical protein